MAEVELCLLVSLPAELWRRPGELSERGELALVALGQALDAYMRRGNGKPAAIMREAGCEYRADSWATRWPGAAGDEVLPREQDDDEGE